MGIRDIGGAQQYLHNKVNYLKTKGYKTYVFSSLYGLVYIESLKEFESQIIPAIMYSPTCFTNNEVNSTLRKMMDIIGPCDNECIIESTSIDGAIWGEMLAERLKTLHVIFDLQEVHTNSPSQIAFLKFKLKRGELAGIVKQSVGQMLNDDNIEATDEMVIHAPCINVVQEIDSSLVELLDINAKLTIGSIGRLEKAFLPKVLKELKGYFVAHSDTLYNLVLIGGSGEEVVSNIKNMFKDIDNVHLVITGYLYPIPLSLLKKIDLFISTAGSTHVSYKAGRPSIMVHPITGRVVGIEGYSFDVAKNTMYDETDATIESQIDLILSQKIHIVYPEDPYKKEKLDIMNEFDREMKIALKNKDNREYYNMSKVHHLYTPKNILYSIFGHLLGGDKMQHLADFYREKFLNA
jgi:hypothetical protein